MDYTQILPFDKWNKLNGGKGTVEEYQTYLKEQEEIKEHVKSLDITTENILINSHNVGKMSDREVLNQLLILTSKNNTQLTSINSILILMFVITIILFVVALAM